MNNFFAFIVSIIVATIVSFSCSSGVELAQDVKFLPSNAKERMSIVIPEIKESVNVDGKLDDPAWRSAAVIEKLLPYPNYLPLAVKGRRVLLMYDQQNLYVGMQVSGEDARKLGLAEQGGKPDVWAGRMAEIFLNPTGNVKAGRYQFCLNAIGTRYDESPAQCGAWQGKWTGKGSVQEDCF